MSDTVLDTGMQENRTDKTRWLCGAQISAEGITLFILQMGRLRLAQGS
jgi:hypothetical protein